MPKAVLIDDEKLARADLRARLAAHPEVEITGEAALLDAAAALLQRADYDLVFLDVQLLGGTGFDLVPAVRPGARIIFVTAYDQFALRAFEVNALDYLRKPVRAARLAEALRRASAGRPPPDAPRPAAALAADDIVQVKTGPGAARFVRVGEILLLASQDNYTEVRLTGGERLLVRQTLTAWEQRLPASHFMRVHRQYIVNLSRLEGFANQDEEVTLLRLAGLSEPVRARRQNWPELRTRLAALGVNW
jgi:two-component system LytT family response regulator